MKTTIKKQLGLATATVAVVIGVMTIGHSLAYFSSEKDHASEYNLAVIDTEIEEEFEKEDEQHYVKNPRITNLGESDAIVRVRVEVTDNTQKDNINFIDEDEENNWLLADDGYYYYQGVLKPNETTDTIFDKVEIKDLDAMKDFDIIVYQEAIQTSAYDENGKEYSALENGVYNQAKAMELWQYYK